MRGSTIFVWLAAALLAAPVVQGWGVKGMYEPDTLRDRNNGWMFNTTPTSSLQNRVYLNGFLAECAYPLCTGFTPNSALLRSMVHGTQTIPYALLGVWRDCNRDNYIGFAEFGLIEYRVELLSDTSVCRAATIPNPIPNDWMPVHNDGQWVHEFLPIQWRAWNQFQDINPFNINDNGSRVWMDDALPEADLGAGGGCWIRPHPTGTYHSTGGLLYTYDCLAGYRATDTLNEQGDKLQACTPSPLPRSCTTINETGLDELGRGQLTFDDHPRDQYNSASPLNQPTPWGEESDASYVEAWDCTQPQLARHQVNNNTWVNVSRPRAPPTANPGGSPFGTLNSTLSGFDECRRTAAENAYFHPGQTAAETMYEQLEGDVTNSPAKDGTNVLRPDDQARNPAVQALLGRGAPPDLGNRITGTAGMWGSNTVTLLRGNFQYMTFYALVSDAAITKYGLTMPKGTAKGIYGAEACSVIGAGAPNEKGWFCDPAKWYRDAAGADIQPRSTYIGPSPGVPVSGLPGSLYNLRDIDCWDASTQALRERGISWGAVPDVPPQLPPPAARVCAYGP